MYRYTIGDKSGSIQTRPAGRKAQMSLVARVADLMLGWTDRMRQRRHLAELDDRLLQDIGLSRADVEAEISRPFWRPRY
jgi:uncharacterized protein YjiS (DUF1127 family)